MVDKEQFMEKDDDMKQIQNQIEDMTMDENVSQPKDENYNQN